MIGRTASTLLRRQCASLSTSAVANPLIKRQTTGIISRPVGVRSLHSVPELDRGEEWRKDGIAPLFTPEGFETAWTTYQGTLVEKLNQLVAETVYENETAQATALSTARRPEWAPVFNYASQAHNNHFFFQTLTSAATRKNIPERMLSDITDTFGSFEAMRSEFLGTANAIFGSGWVWLVVDQTQNLRILATYNAGSPYRAAVSRQQAYDTNHFPSRPNVAGAGDVRDQTRAAAARGRGQQLPVPLLALSVWPQTWMHDYGVHGKEQYLSAWWECVDWDVVQSRHTLKRQDGPLFTR